MTGAPNPTLPLVQQFAYGLDAPTASSKLHPGCRAGPAPEVVVLANRRGIG